MQTQRHSHHKKPQLWFRRSSQLSAHAIAALIESGRISATPRLGVRDAEHPKGYKPDQLVELVVFDDSGFEHWRATRRVTTVHVRKPIRSLEPKDLHHTFFYSNWEDVHRDLEHFAGESIPSDAAATIVEWSI